MTVMPTWKPIIGLGLQGTWATGAVAGAGIPSTGPKGIAPTNLPDLNPNVEIIESLKHHGQPPLLYRGGEGITEIQVGPKTAGTTIEMDVDPVSIVPFLASVCQDLQQGGATNYQKTFHNYDRATDIDFIAKSGGAVGAPPILLSIIRNNAIDDPALAGESQRMDSAIVRALTISGTRGEPIKASAEIVGRSLDVAYTVNTDDFTLPRDNATPLLFQDTTFKYRDIKESPLVAMTETDVIAFSLALTNNVEVQHYNSQDVGNLVLGRFDVNGSLTLPWRNNDWIERFLDNDPIVLKFIWGTAGTAPFLSLETAVVFTGETTAGDTEVEVELPFRGVAYTRLSSGESEEFYYPSEDASIECVVIDELQYTV